MIKLRITPEQKEYCKYHAKKEIEYNQAWKTRRNTYFRTEKEVRLLQYLGEVVVADYCGVKRPRSEPGYKKPYDLLIAGRKIDVKATKYSKNNLSLLVKEYILSDYIDFYCLVQISKDVAIIHGVATPKELRKREKVNLGFEDNYGIPAEDLTDLTEAL